MLITLLILTVVAFLAAGYTGDRPSMYTFAALTAFLVLATVFVWLVEAGKVFS